MGVALGGGHPRVAEDFLYDADMHTLFHKECSGCVASVVESCVTNARPLQERFPRLVVLAPFHRPAVPGGEHEIVPIPQIPAFSRSAACASR
ncbi:hypothetical protein GCM10022252_08280 [Streptosporangium oxazolinicum]|uniref:Uncharacterized protein n=1 Tax=Streptosporangium oxazolinicum TaxID=909287 RepID=A0ABP8AE13_9ACTN